MKKRIYRGVMIGMLSVSLLSGLYGCSSKSKDVKGNPLEKEGYTLLFNDEFDGTELDTTKWLPQYFPHATDSAPGCMTTYEMKDGCVNIMIDDQTPFYNNNSIMKVSSIQTFEKNLLHPGAGTTNVTNVVSYESFATQYGYFEMRAKLPDCKGGGHIAWWMIGTQDDAREDGTLSKQTAEIDILENILEYTNVFSPKVHAWTDEGLSEFGKEVGLDGTYDDSYHIYAMDWTPQGIKFLVDGEAIASTKNSPKYRMAMLIGIYTFAEDGWSGNDNGVYPKTFSIDYIRVYHDNNGYPDGETLPSTPVTLPEDSAIQCQAQPVTEDITQASFYDPAVAASFSTDATGKDISNLFDRDYATDFCSDDAPVLPAEFVFEWDIPQNVDVLRIGSWYAAGQAPTYLELMAKKTEEWESLGLYNVAWISASDMQEYVDIPVNVSDITGLKLVVKNANLGWNHYVMTELQLIDSAGEAAVPEEPDTEAASEAVDKSEPADQPESTTEVKQEPGAKDDDKTSEGTPSGKGEALPVLSGSNLSEASVLSYHDGAMSGAGLQSVKEVGTDNAYVSEDNPDMGKQYIQFNWEEAVSFDRVILSSRYCGTPNTDGQAPTSWEIYISRDGTDNWKKVGKIIQADWEAGDALQGKAVDVSGAKDVKGVRVQITDANLSWGHYAVYSIEIGDK